MTMRPIAAAAAALYTPLILRGSRTRSEHPGQPGARERRPCGRRPLQGLAFVVVLAFAVYVVVLLIAAVVSYPSRFYDMVLIILVVCAFFALLLWCSS